MGVTVLCTYVVPAGVRVELRHTRRGEHEFYTIVRIEGAQMSGEIEQKHEQTSKDVATVVDHLRANRTTESEARNLRDAATKSLVDHATAKSIGRLP